jgi:hypothetical protein
MVEKSASEKLAWAAGCRLSYQSKTSFWLAAQSAATCSHWFLARGFLYPEDGDDTFIRNVGLHKTYTVPHPRRRNSSSKYLNPKSLTSDEIWVSLCHFNKGEIAPCTYCVGGWGQLGTILDVDLEKICCPAGDRNPSPRPQEQSMLQLTNLFFINVLNKSLSLFLNCGGNHFQFQPDTGYHLVSLSPSSKFWDSTAIRPIPLPSKPFSIHYSSVIVHSGTINLKSWLHLKVNHKMPVFFFRRSHKCRSHRRALIYCHSFLVHSLLKSKFTFKTF